MSARFNPGQGLIVVTARIWGPLGDTYARLVLDKGASTTLVNEAKLLSIGLDPATSPEQISMTTGSGRIHVNRQVVDTVEALGQQRRSLPVLCHTLPPTAAVDGLLGLDFLRNQFLTIDFRNGLITLI